MKEEAGRESSGEAKGLVGGERESEKGSVGVLGVEEVEGSRRGAEGPGSESMM